MTYFAGTNNSPGVMLYIDRTDDDAWTTHIFRFLDNKWADQTSTYLDSLKLSKSDFVLAPQYGRAVRVLTYKNGVFTHKEWITWNGQNFVSTPSAVHWRCPSSVRYLDKKTANNSAETRSKTSESVTATLHLASAPPI